MSYCHVTREWELVYVGYTTAWTEKHTSQSEMDEAYEHYVRVNGEDTRPMYTRRTRVVAVTEWEAVT